CPDGPSIPSAARSPRAARHFSAPTRPSCPTAWPPTLSAGTVTGHRGLPVGSHIVTHSLNLVPPSRCKKVMQLRPGFCRCYAYWTPKKSADPQLDFIENARGQRL